MLPSVVHNASLAAILQSVALIAIGSIAGIFFYPAIFNSYLTMLIWGKIGQLLVQTFATQ